MTAPAKHCLALALIAVITPLAAPSALAQVAGDPAPGMGRLFFSPEHRAALELQRLYNIQETRALEGPTLSLDGIVVRSGGKSTVWINGRPQHESDAVQTGIAAHLNPKSPGSAVLSTGADGPARINVGETMNRATGEHNNRLGGGLVVAPDRNRRPRP